MKFVLTFFTGTNGLDKKIKFLLGIPTDTLQEVHINRYKDLRISVRKLSETVRATIHELRKTK